MFDNNLNIKRLLKDVVKCVIGKMVIEEFAYMQ